MQKKKEKKKTSRLLGPVLTKETSWRVFFLGGKKRPKKKMAGARRSKTDTNRTPQSKKEEPKF